MDKPLPPPEAALLRLVRTAAGIKAADAAASVARRSQRRFSASRWSQIENGYETRDGGYKPVRANAATLAHMAYAVGIPPERLESDGRRADAAEVLREILRNEPPRLSRAPEPPRILDDDSDELIRTLIARYPPLVRDTLTKIWGLELSRPERVKLMKAWLADHPESPRARAAG